jgi:hypothetical protein
MISLALVTAMTLAAAQADPTVLPRKTFASCLSAFKKNGIKEKVEPAAFSASAKTACEAEAAALKKALVSLDMSRGGKRAEAESNADFDIRGYRENMEESYKDHFAPAPE